MESLSAQFGSMDSIGRESPVTVSLGEGGQFNSLARRKEIREKWKGGAKKALLNWVKTSITE